MSGEFEVAQVADEFEVAQATAETVRIEHGSPDRARARELFERLAQLIVRGFLRQLRQRLGQLLLRVVDVFEFVAHQIFERFHT